MSTKKRAAKKVPINYQNGKIYKIVNDVNDMVYIGSTTTTLAQRFYGHKTKVKDRTSKFYDAIREIGIGHFQIVLIELFPCTCKSELEAREFVVAGDHAKDKLYNSIMDGKHSSESREKMKANCVHFSRGSIGQYSFSGRDIFKFSWQEDGKQRSKAFSFGKMRTKEEAYEACVDLQNQIYPLANKDPCEEMLFCE